MNERLTILWNLCKDQSEWQRHNESQRANLTWYLLLISAALIALVPKANETARMNWLLPTFLIVIGLLGVWAVLKYWERFMFHARIEKMFYKELSSLLQQAGDASAVPATAEPTPRSIWEMRERAIRGHEKKTCFLFRDKRFMQHWIWLALYLVVAGFGVSLLFL